MGAATRFRDALHALVPPWLSDRVSWGKTAGFRFLWSMVAPLDAAVEVMLQGLYARYPGLGTPTALPLIGRSRGLIRNQGETDDAYAARLRAWLDTWPEAGSEIQIAKSVHDYLSSKPRVRIVNRAGKWTTINHDGTIEYAAGNWDWDSVSHPERNDPDEPWWSDLWLIVYMPSQWPLRTGGLEDLTGDDGYAIGHLATHGEVDAVKGLLQQWKAAHSRIRAVIWTIDEALFDPEDEGTLPDGTWGAWSVNDGGSQVASGRNTTTCRYWEPR